MKTHIATSSLSNITIRGLDLADEIIGHYDFVHMIYFLITGKMPSRDQSKLLDACLVTMMEHGWTPTSLIARMVADSVPGQAQVGIAAGLMAVGDVFGGTMQGCAELLIRLAASNDAEVESRAIVDDHRRRNHPVAGFGHPVHKRGDPRTRRLFELARATALPCRYIDLVQHLSEAVNRDRGKAVVINASGAVAALLLEIGIPPPAIRSISVISRSGGLAAHLVEEEKTHAARRIWQLAEEHIPYESPGE